MNETDLRIRLCEEIMRDRDLCPMCEELAEIVRKNLEGAAKGRRTGPSDYLPPKNKAWPNYAISLAGASRNHSGNGPDRSMADFTWCMTAIDWGWPIEETATKLPEVSEKARERVQMGMTAIRLSPPRMPPQPWSATR